MLGLSAAGKPHEALLLGASWISPKSKGNPRKAFQQGSDTPKGMSIYCSKS